MNKDHFIYGAREPETGYLYVGRTINGKYRWWSHKSNPHRAEWDFFILEYCKPEKQDERERFWIDFLQPKLNKRITAAGGMWSVRESTKQKLSRVNRVACNTTEFKQTKRIQAIAQIESKGVDDFLQRFNKPGAKEKSSAKKKQLWAADEFKLKMSEAQRAGWANKPRTPEQTAARSAWVKKSRAEQRMRKLAFKASAIIGIM